MLQDTASVLPTAKPQVPLESVLGRLTPEPRRDSAASWANPLSHSACARLSHSHLQPQAFWLVFSKHQGIQQPQWPLFQLNLPESRCTDPPESSRTHTGVGPLCEAHAAVHCWRLCCVWGECWNGLVAPVKAIPLLLGTVYLNYISLIIFFFLLFDVAGGWELYHLCELLILLKSFFFAAFSSCLFPQCHWSSSAPAPQAKAGTSLAKHWMNLGFN